MNLNPLAWITRPPTAAESARALNARRQLTDRERRDAMTQRLRADIAAGRIAYMEPRVKGRGR